MSFSKNKIGMLRMEDPLFYLTKSQVDYIKNGWAGYFYENVFKNINEDTFRVLFSEGKGRYNNPINETVGFLLLKDVTGLSDRILVNEAALDLRYKYALGCTNRQGSPVKTGTVSKFRRKLREYKKQTGRDLLAEEKERFSTETEFLRGSFAGNK